jgi:hypothetical protein
MNISYLPHHDRPAFNPMIKNTSTVAMESFEGETTPQQNRRKRRT